MHHLAAVENASNTTEKHEKKRRQFQSRQIRSLQQMWTMASVVPSGYAIRFHQQRAEADGTEESPR